MVSTQASITSDLLFLIDAGSRMKSSTKDYIMDIVRNFISQTKTALPPFDGGEVRLGFIAYRNFGVKPQFVLQDFTPSVTLFHHSLSGLDGNQCAEGKAEIFAGNMINGLKMATMFSWKNAARVLVHIGIVPALEYDTQDLGTANDQHFGKKHLRCDLNEIFQKLKIYCKVCFGAALCTVLALYSEALIK